MKHEESERLIPYYFAKAHKDPYDTCRWVQRTVQQNNQSVEVTFPDNWSLPAIEAMATAFIEVENDLRQAINRLVNTITRIGYDQGYFVTEQDADAFHAELKYLLVTQKATFSQEVWRSVGRQQPVEVLAPMEKEKNHRISDLFMRAVEADGEWRALEPPYEKGKARDIWQAIVRDIWSHSDTRLEYTDVQVATTILHGPSIFTPAAQVNMMEFVANEEVVIEQLQHTASILYIALDILTQHLQLAAPEATDRLRYDRPISLGMTNVAAALQAQGLAYESDAARATAGLWQALLSGQAWTMSAQLAGILGAFVGFERHTSAVGRVLRHGLQACQSLIAASETLRKPVNELWQQLPKYSKAHGLRNCFLGAATDNFMDRVLAVDTAGLEPFTRLTSTVPIASGGQIVVVNESIPAALKKLGYDKERAIEIIDHIHEGKQLGEIPYLKTDHVSIFATTVNMKQAAQSYIALTGAVQSFVQGAVSEIMTLAESTSLREMEKLLAEAWYAGLPIVALRREGAVERQETEVVEKKETSNHDTNSALSTRQVRTLPKVRSSKTFTFTIDTTPGYLIVSEFSDGTPGEILLHTPTLEAATAATLQAWAHSVSIGLQNSVPLRTYAQAAVNYTFAPKGETDDEAVPQATSIIDYTARRLAVQYLSQAERRTLGLEGDEDDVHEAQVRLIE